MKQKFNMKEKKNRRKSCGFSEGVNSVFNNLENLHRAGLYAETAGNALGSHRRILCFDHNMEGAGFLTGTAAGAELLIHHPDTFRILSDCTVRASFCAFAALNTYHRLCLALKIHNLKAGFILMEFLVECF